MRSLSQVVHVLGNPERRRKYAPTPQLFANEDPTFGKNDVLCPIVFLSLELRDPA